LSSNRFLGAVVLAIVLLSLSPAAEIDRAEGREPLYPGSSWTRAERPEELGWSTEKLDLVRSFAQRIGSAALMIVDDGLVVLSWGRVEENFKCHSVRKSLLSALIGIQVQQGKIDLSKSLAELGIDDCPPRLSPTEKRATVADLLKARSGVYHLALGESPEMKAQRPKRHSHQPGELWYYNNWDFNALGTIFEQETGRSIFEEFERRLAGPLQMADFSRRLCGYQSDYQGRRPGEGECVSIHRRYTFRLSARDLARFGLLYLRDGRWGESQIVPREWVRESTASHSIIGPERGYGYMWWTGQGAGLMPHVRVRGHCYYAAGYRGHRIIVLPFRRLIVVLRVDTFDYKVSLGNDQIGRLLWLILDAAGEKEIGPPVLIEADAGLKITGENIGLVYGKRKTLEISGCQGRCLEVYHPDGRAEFRSSLPEEPSDAGRWWFEGETFCLKWNRLDQGRTMRLRLRLQDRTLSVYDGEGLLVRQLPLPLAQGLNPD